MGRFDELVEAGRGGKAAIAGLTEMGSGDAAWWSNKREEEDEEDNRKAQAAAKRLLKAPASNDPAYIDCLKILTKGGGWRALMKEKKYVRGPGRKTAERVWSDVWASIRGKRESFDELAGLTEAKAAVSVRTLLIGGGFDWDDRKEGYVVNAKPDHVERYLRRNGARNIKVKRHAMGALVIESESAVEWALAEAGPGPGLARFKHNKKLAKKHGGVATSAGVYSFPKRGAADAFIQALNADYPGISIRAETKRIDKQMRFLVRFDEFKEDEERDGDDLTEGKGAAMGARKVLGKLRMDLLRHAKHTLVAVYWTTGEAEEFNRLMKVADAALLKSASVLTQASVGEKRGEKAKPKRPQTAVFGGPRGRPDPSTYGAGRFGEDAEPALTEAIVAYTTDLPAPGDVVERVEMGEDNVADIHFADGKRVPVHFIEEPEHRLEHRFDQLAGLLTERAKTVFNGDEEKPKPEPEEDEPEEKPKPACESCGTKHNGGCPGASDDDEPEEEEPEEKTEQQTKPKGTGNDEEEGEPEGEEKPEKPEKDEPTADPIDEWQRAVAKPEEPAAEPE